MTTLDIRLWTAQWFTACPLVLEKCKFGESIWYIFVEERMKDVAPSPANVRFVQVSTIVLGALV